MLATIRRAEEVKATLCNDVKLRGIKGRSAMLLGVAKDNKARCAISPFIPLFDKRCSLDILQRSDRVPPWAFGLPAIIANLAGRGLLHGALARAVISRPRATPAGKIATC